MKDTILYQTQLGQKRETLMKSICHNVRYMAKLSENNALDLKLTKEKLEAVQKWNEKLQDENLKLNNEVDLLREDQRKLDEKRGECEKLLVDCQANRAEIEKLNSTVDNNHDKMEKLNLEITVVVQEKMSLNNEYNALTIDFRRLTSEFKAARENFDNLVDENTNILKQNNAYRGLLLDNEKQLQMISSEIQDMQRIINSKNIEITRKQEEATVYKMQVEKLIEELKEKSDSESFDDEKEKLLNMKKAREAEMLTEKIKNLEVQIKLNQSDAKASMKRIEDNLQFSRDSNQNLKNDYDLLTEKMAKI